MRWSDHDEGSAALSMEPERAMVGSSGVRGDRMVRVQILAQNKWNEMECFEETLYFLNRAHMR